MKTILQHIHRHAAMLTITLILLASAPIVCAQSTGQKQLAQSWAELIAASQSYRESLVRVLALQEQEQTRTAELIAKQKSLLALGAISRRDVEAGEQAFTAAQSRAKETRHQLAEVDQLIAEANATELSSQPSPASPRSLPSPRHLLNRTNKPSATSSRNVLIRYAGTSAWALSDFGQVEAYFRTKFGKPLAVSAFGQSATHTFRLRSSRGG